jgi:ubiquinone/menaquinone biosynthesis C-methylase UbiE
MTKPRVPGTDQGLQGEFNTKAYDQMMRQSRDKNELQIQHLFQKNIIQGLALEIGPGPGYIGLEWLKRTQDTQLIGLDISSDMIQVAMRNTEEYGFSERAEYRQGTGSKLPFEDNTFDVVFSYDSLHEWTEPENTFNEIHRVLKNAGKYLIYDLRRDMPLLIKWFLLFNTRYAPKELKSGLTASIRSAYLESEIMAMLKHTRLFDGVVEKNPFGLIISGKVQKI